MQSGAKVTGFHLQLHRTIRVCKVQRSNTEFVANSSLCWWSWFKGKVVANGNCFPFVSHDYFCVFFQSSIAGKAILSKFVLKNNLDKDIIVYLHDFFWVIFPSMGIKIFGSSKGLRGDKISLAKSKQRVNQTKIFKRTL